MPNIQENYTEDQLEIIGVESPLSPDFYPDPLSDSTTLGFFLKFSKPLKH